MRIKNNRNMRLFTKSKTFLIGEYSVMYGGEAIILLSQPVFSLLVYSNQKHCVDKTICEFLHNFPISSPAYDFYEQHKDIFDGLTLKFICENDDSHMLGMGSSSAQFSLLYKVYLKLINQRFDIKTFIENYTTLGCNKNFAPSGADCVVQFINKSSYINLSLNKVENISWNFKDISIIILKTNVKIATHEHLISAKFLYGKLDFDLLNMYTRQAYNAFVDLNSSALIYSINAFYNYLKEKQLVHQNTQFLVNEIMNISGVVAAKGCGALLADTLVVIFESSKSNNVYSKLKTLPNLNGHYYL